MTRPHLSMEGVTTGPDQRWGNVRLVPLLRRTPVEGLRLHPALSGTGPTRDEGVPDPVAYLPHAYVAHWEEDPLPMVSYGTRLCSPWEPPSPARIRPVDGRDRGRGDLERPRFLPWSVNVEGHLALRFSVTTIAWERLARTLLRTERLRVPKETAYTGAEVGDLSRALEVFEVHTDQCGVVLYVGDEPASVHLTPHPDDYRTLHPSLLWDLFGGTLHAWGGVAAPVPSLYEPLPKRGIRSLDDLRRAVAESRAASARGRDALMPPVLTAQDTTFHRVGERDAFALWRLCPPLVRGGGPHVGEVITAADGRPAYLSTFRLSTAQVRRGTCCGRWRRRVGRSTGPRGRWRSPRRR
ncbi:hypothetical protein [Nocardiopsis sp. MG754419]|uniref:ARPP-2 domain-containing protein n=1 Tax=Nocardiopsis sp. MG754419 TaxID=2259865 RepID=UPI001BA6D888|nr:hypothetical protein [Nocardiopsis sp. MG754419]MBR8744760.1 hypothetical protein [Nocardiopsis sp. MG754419]